MLERWVRDCSLLSDGEIILSFLVLTGQGKGSGIGWKIGLGTVALGITAILVIGICSLILGWGVGD